MRTEGSWRQARCDSAGRAGFVCCVVMMYTSIVLKTDRQTGRQIQLTLHPIGRPPVQRFRVVEGVVSPLTPVHLKLREDWGNDQGVISRM